MAGAGLYLSTLLLTGMVNVPPNDALALVGAGDTVAAQSSWTEFVPRWTMANHVRSAAALAAAVLLAWR